MYFKSLILISGVYYRPVHSDTIVSVLYVLLYSIYLFLQAMSDKKVTFIDQNGQRKQTGRNSVILELHANFNS